MMGALREVQVTAGLQPITPSQIKLIAHPQIHGPGQNRQVIVVGVHGTSRQYQDCQSRDQASGVRLV